MKRTGCLLLRPCGGIGYVHVGLLKCANILRKETHISLHHHQTSVVGVEVRVEDTSTTGNAQKCREELRIQYNFKLKAAHAKKVVTVTSAGAGKRETHVDPDASAKAVSTLEQQTGMTLWRDTVTLKTESESETSCDENIETEIITDFHESRNIN